MPGRKNDEGWIWLMSQIKDLWTAKKKRPLMFSGQDAKLLKLMRNWFTDPELAALYHLYLRDSPFWGPRTGYLVSGMYQERAVLTDLQAFKALTKEYAGKFGEAEPKQVLLDLGLEAKKI